MKRTRSKKSRDIVPLNSLSTVHHNTDDSELTINVGQKKGFLSLIESLSINRDTRDMDRKKSSGQHICSIFGIIEAIHIFTT
jgi:hypothetical protein